MICIIVDRVKSWVKYSGQAYVISRKIAGKRLALLISFECSYPKPSFRWPSGAFQFVRLRKGKRRQAKYKRPSTFVEGLFVHGMRFEFLSALFRSPCSLIFSLLRFEFSLNSVTVSVTVLDREPKIFFLFTAKTRLVSRSGEFQKWPVIAVIGFP